MKPNKIVFPLLGAIVLSAGEISTAIAADETNTVAAKISPFEPTIPSKTPAPTNAPEGMVWIPGGEFSMGCICPSSGFCTMATMQSVNDTLNSTAKADGLAAATYAVVVEPVSIPAEVDRPQFIVQVAPNRVAVDEFNRWAAPLSDNIANAVAGDLAVLLGTARVAAVPLANFNADYQVTIDIQKFESVPGKSVTIEAVWAIRKTAGGVAKSGFTYANKPVSGDGFDALAAAHSRALATVSSAIAATIRAEAGEKP